MFNTQKNPLIEQYHITLMNKLLKQQTIKGNQKWLDILQPIVKKYNNTTTVYFNEVVLPSVLGLTSPMAFPQHSPPS